MHASVTWYAHCSIIGRHIGGRILFEVWTRRDGVTVHLGTAYSMVDARAIARGEA